MQLRPQQPLVLHLPPQPTRRPLVQHSSFPAPRRCACPSRLWTCTPAAPQHQSRRRPGRCRASPQGPSTCPPPQHAPVSNRGYADPLRRHHKCRRCAPRCGAARTRSASTSSESWFKKFQPYASMQLSKVPLGAASMNSVITLGVQPPAPPRVKLCFACAFIPRPTSHRP